MVRYLSNCQQRIDFKFWTWIQVCCTVGCCRWCHLGSQWPSHLLSSLHIAQLLWRSVCVQVVLHSRVLQQYESHQWQHQCWSYQNYQSCTNCMYVCHVGGWTHQHLKREPAKQTIHTEFTSTKCSKPKNLKNIIVYYVYT